MQAKNVAPVFGKPACTAPTEQIDGGDSEFRALVIEAYVLDCERQAAEERLALAEEALQAQAATIENLQWWERWGIPVWVITGATTLGLGVWIGLTARD